MTVHQVASGRVYGSRTLPQPARESTSTVAILVWTYQRQMVHVLGNVDLVGPEIALLSDRPARSPDGCARIADIGAVGCEIDGGGYQRRVVHPDADVVASLVADVAWPANELLARYGAHGGQPHWDVRQRLEPIYIAGHAEVRQLGVEVVRYRSGNVKPIPVTYCPVEPYPSNDWVDLCRAEYNLWYKGLVDLTEALRDAGLRRWAVTEIGAEATPWART